MNASPQREGRPAEPVDAQTADLFDWALLRDWSLLLLSSPLRRKLLFATMFVTVFGATFVGLSSLPKSYTAESRILASKGNARGYLPGDEAPTRDVTELVLSDSNLEALVRQTELVETYEGSRSRAGRLRDWLQTHVLGVHPTEDDRRDALVATLEKKLRVSIGGEGTVTLDASWEDPQIAYRLVKAAQDNFLSSKESSEVSAISETMIILETHAASIREEIDAVLGELRTTLERDAAQSASSLPAGRRSAPAAVARKPFVNPKAESLRALLMAKRDEIRQKETERTRQLDGVQAELARLRTLYTEHHPLVVDAATRLEALRPEPPDLLELRAEAAQLEDEITTAGGSVQAAATSAPRPLSFPVEATAENKTGDPQVDYLAAQLRLLVTKYNNLLDRIDSARIDLETTQSAFKQRYRVIKPPHVPIRPDNLRPPLVVAVAFTLALALAFFAAAVADFSAGRIVRPWQVEWQLGLPVLARFEKK